MLQREAEGLQLMKGYVLMNSPQTEICPRHIGCGTFPVNNTALPTVNYSHLKLCCLLGAEALCCFPAF